MVTVFMLIYRMYVCVCVYASAVHGMGDKDQMCVIYGRRVTRMERNKRNGEKKVDVTDEEERDVVLRINVHSIVISLKFVVFYVVWLYFLSFSIFFF